MTKTNNNNAVENKNDTEIKQKFGFFGITAYIIGIIIGSGIFLTSNQIFRSLGSWGSVLLVWILAGFLTILGALSWAELAVAHPRQGGTYIYLLTELGHYPAFLYIISRVLLLNPLNQAITAIASAQQIQEIFSVSGESYSTELLAICLLMLMTFLQSFHTKITSWINTIITGVKILTLVGIFIAAIVNTIRKHPELEPAFDSTSVKPLDWVNAFYGCYWSFAGWQSISAVIEEIENPKKTFPRAVITGVSVVTLVYVLTNLSFFLVLSYSQINESTFIVSSFAAEVSGFSLAVPFSILVFLSYFGSFLCSGLVSGRYMFSAAREGDLPSPLALLHYELNTPIPAQVLHMCICILLVVITNKIFVLLGLFVFVTIGYDLLVLASLFKLKYRTRNESSEQFRVSVVAPILYATFLAAVFITSLIQGITIEVVIPVIFLVVFSIVYIVVFKRKIFSIDFSRIEIACSKAFLLIHPTESKKD